MERQAAQQTYQDCPQCQAKGTVTVTFQEWGKPETAQQNVQPCPSCEGKKQVTKKFAQRIIREQKKADIEDAKWEAAHGTH